MARFVVLPVLGYGCAAEEQRDDVGEQIAGHEEEDGPGGVSERLADAE